MYERASEKALLGPCGGGSDCILQIMQALWELPNGPILIRRAHSFCYYLIIVFIITPPYVVLLKI